MTSPTIQLVAQRQRPGTRAPAWAAVALVGLEGALSTVGAAPRALSAVALVVAPGLALAGLLPARTRVSWAAVVAAAPALGLAASSIALISVASAGLPLHAGVVRAVIAAVAVCGLLIAGPVPGRLSRADALACGGVIGAAALAVLLHQRVLGGATVPGNDWAKYVLYADEIRRHGSLLIDNPFWMLGVPFREDPGTPALYAAYLELTGAPASAVARGIGALATIQVLSVFALVRTWWGPGAGVAAAALWAALPINNTILGWHGLANVAALVLLPLALLYAAALLEGEAGVRVAGGAAIVLLGVAAAHRLSLLVAAVALAATLAVRVAMRGWRQSFKPFAVTAAAFLALSPGVVYDLVSRGRTFGGTQPYTAYLSTKLDLVRVIQDLTVPFSIAAVLAGALALRWSRRDRPLLPLLCTLGAVLALGFSWIVHLPLYYTRLAYFLPLALVPLVAGALARLRPRHFAATTAVVLAGYAAVVSYVRADDVRNRYEFANPASLRGLDAVAAALARREVVVTDRCWSFLGTWLLHTRTLPALEPEDIQPNAELSRARQASSVLSGTPAGRALAHRLGIRFALVDPTCTDSHGRPARAPRMARPVFVSERLVVLRLPSGPP